MLLDKGARINSRDRNGKSPLGRAALGGHVNVAKLLVNKGAKLAVDERQTILFDFLVPLQTREMGNESEILSILLDKEADVNYTRVWDGGTPLHIAAEIGRVELMRALWERGASFEVRDRWGESPLHRATLRGEVEAVRFLLDEGANPNALDNRGSSPLTAAAEYGDVEIARLLLQRGAEMDARNLSGESPLHCAAKEGDLKMVRFLLIEGADVCAETNQGDTPRDVAEEYNEGFVEQSEEYLEVIRTLENWRTHGRFSMTQNYLFCVSTIASNPF